VLVLLSLWVPALVSLWLLALVSLWVPVLLLSLAVRMWLAVLLYQTRKPLVVRSEPLLSLESL